MVHQTRKLRVSVRANFQPSFGQCLNNAFRYLLGLLQTEFLVWTFIQALRDRRRNYRNHLMLINHLTLRAAKIVCTKLQGILGSIAVIQSVEGNGPTAWVGPLHSILEFRHRLELILGGIVDHVIGIPVGVAGRRGGRARGRSPYAAVGRCTGAAVHTRRRGGGRTI